MTDAKGGLLQGMPHPLAQSLIYDPALQADLAHSLPALIDIDAAHVVMLLEQGLISNNSGEMLLAANRELRRRQREGEPVSPRPERHRGLYFVFEREIEELTGGEIPGAGHLGRSRNDIGATIARLRARSGWLTYIASLDELVGTVLETAQKHLHTEMCSFSQMQPAQPSSFAYYLASIATELVEALAQAETVLRAIDTCPMGACAGSGTSVAIRPERVAELLGFTAASKNAAHAVTSRTYIAQGQAQLAISGITLTRFCTDLHQWCCHPFNFFALPDDLVSSSSAMPQKRNPFLFETLRGRYAQAVGGLVNVLTGQKNVPYGNGVEAGTEASSHFFPSMSHCAAANGLLGLLVKSLIANPEPMRELLDQGLTWVTALAEHLALTYSIPFRTAHSAVGKAIRTTQAKSENAQKIVAVALANLADQGFDVPSDPGHLTEQFAKSDILLPAHGGGPAPPVVELRLRELDDRRSEIKAGWSAALARHQAYPKTLDDTIASIVDNGTFR